MHFTSNFYSKFNKLIEWIMNFSISNLLWFFVNLPIGFILFNLFFVPIKIGVFYYFVAFAICIPLLFFPSTVALFAICRDWVLNRPQSTLFFVYVRYFKENYKKSCLAGMIITVLWFVWIGDYYFFRDLDQALLQYLFNVIGAVLFVYTIQFFSLVVHYNVSLKNIMKKALIITFARPLTSFFILGISLSIIFVSVTKVWFMIPFFMGSTIAFVSFYLFNQIYAKINKNE